MSEAACSGSKYPHQKVQARPLTGDPVMYKRYVLPLLLCFAGLPTMATATESANALEDLAEVNSFRLLGQASDWNALDRDTLIVWASPSRAYLIELQRPSHDLRFAQAIGLTSTAGRVAAGFDDVLIEGWSYRIKSIHALDRARTKELLSNAHRTT